MDQPHLPPFQRTDDAPSWWRPSAIAVNRIRLISGLWLLLYAATHLVNHALGLISLAAAEAGRGYFLAFWRLPPVEAGLLLALLVHAALGLWKLWQRRTLRMRWYEAVQLLLAVAIPTYLTVHVLATGWLHRCCGVEDSYSYFLDRAWPDGVLSQSMLTVLVWLHGVIGLHFWLRLRSWYAPLQSSLLVLATLLPVLALTGYASAGREVVDLRAADPAGWAELGAAQRWPDDALRQAQVQTPERWIVRGFLALVVLVLLLRIVRWLWLRRRDVRLSYPGGLVVSVPRQVTILEGSRIAGVPHAAVCGGRGRCSTCRVRVGRGAERLPPASAEERRVLARIGAPGDVRLACQTRLAGDLAVTPLMPATATVLDALSPLGEAHGVEREVAVLFADLRDFTRLSEGRLPYDTVFILNRYFRAMGEVVEASGGRVDKFIGDGIMALFGLDQDPRDGARSALAAANGMAKALELLNRDLAVELDAPLRMGIGVHVGPAILGRIGHGPANALTAIGDTVNVASRLESATKEFACQLIVSERVIDRAGMAADRWPRAELDLRGRTGRLAVRLIEDATSLPGLADVGDGRRDWERARRLLGRARVASRSWMASAVPGRFPLRRASWLDTPRRKGRNIDGGP